MCVCAWDTHATIHGWRSEDDFVELALLLPGMGLGSEGLCGQGLSLLSHWLGLRVWFSSDHPTAMHVLKTGCTRISAGCSVWCAFPEVAQTVRGGLHTCTPVTALATQPVSSKHTLELEDRELGHEL